MQDFCCQAHGQKLLKHLAETLKVIAEPNRLRILCLLSAGPQCVCEIEGCCGLRQNLVSHHLKVLKDAGLISAAKKKQWKYYSLNRPKVEEWEALLQQILKAKQIAKPKCCKC